MPKSSIVCVDASFVLRLLLGGPGSDKAEELWERWGHAEIRTVAPGLISYEITNALYRLFIGAAATFEETAEFLELALGLEIDVISDSFLHRKALLIAHKCRLKSAYDAHYLALAQSLDADLWTADRRLVNAVTEIFPWVKFLGEA